MTDDELDRLIEDAVEEVCKVGDDTRLLTQEESVEFYRGVASECGDRAQTIQEEMEDD